MSERKESMTKGLAARLLPRALTRRLRTFTGDQHGAVATVVAVAMPVLIGSMALSAEVGHWYVVRGDLQNAADVAAHAGAIQRRSGGDWQAIEVAARTVAESSGYDAAFGETFLVQPPQAGTPGDVEGAVEVILTEARPRYLTAFFDSEPVVVSARAIAGLGEGDPDTVACVLTLGDDSRAMRLVGSGRIELQGCGAAINSTAADAFYMDGGGSGERFQATCAYTVGGTDVAHWLTPQLSQCDEIETGAPAVPDPYLLRPFPDPQEIATLPCDGPQSYPYPWQGPTTLTPTSQLPDGTRVMRFCDGFDSPGGRLVLEAGLYYFEGDLNIAQDTEVTGENVTLMVEGGRRISFAGGASFGLDAPDDGTFQGLLLVAAPHAGTVVEHVLAGAADSAVNGAIYLPSDQLEFAAGSGTFGGCLQIVARRVVASGAGLLRSTCQPTGSEPIYVKRKIAILQ